eukprot:402266_1
MSPSEISPPAQSSAVTESSFKPRNVVSIFADVLLYIRKRSSHPPTAKTFPSGRNRHTPTPGLPLLDNSLDNLHVPTFALTLAAIRIRDGSVQDAASFNEVALIT